MIKRTITMAALAASLLVSAAASAATQASVRVSNAEGGEWTMRALVKDGATYVDAGLWESAGMLPTWDKAHKRVEYDGFNKKVAVRLGSQTGMLDGKLVDLGGTPFQFAERVYVPLRFAAGALGGSVTSWDAKSRIAVVRGLRTYASAKAEFGGVTYSIDKENGNVYAATAATGGAPKLLAKLGSKLYDMVSFDFIRTPGGLLMITITDVYGEPHINNAHYTLVLKHGGVIRQVKSSYWMRFGTSGLQFGDKLALTDGRTLRVIEDGSGRVTATYDLVKLGGEDGRYLVEGIGDDYLLIRPNDSGLLTFVDPRTGTSTKLYKALLSDDLQEYAETNDVPYRGDDLVYVKREGNELLFSNQAPIVQDDKIYRFAIPDGK